MTNNPSDPVIGWFQILQRGKKYMKTWPLDRRLAPIFAENRVVNMTLFGIRFMPPLAIFTLTWQIALGGQLAPAIATAFFACSLPLQGLWWLGKRSMMPLPLTLLQWFHSVRQKLSEAGKRVVPVETTPTYQSLAELLKSAFGQLDETFFDDL
ncbi:terminus macrodomain insulation protein YfbV [Candidatus Fukatsuia symbiotica]|uniref:terminus macrodomain insulation protein YfbV n=1 Tax=Candidatus Fukatsuia TaxID=1927833 RepID=UPI0009353DE5|nr:terminus macrodomain insulation protein YfbV [Candidatus Fukatsuia symbiotica]MEA9444069.1 terminus macrodomain insulation protein YfbV [Candidatus Fukatsuia symbiotica]